jgi:phosphohistidine phosphatase SixA
MKVLKILIIIFISLNVSIKVNSKEQLVNSLKEGGKLIFIRHAYAQGTGDPDNFDIKDCSTQRNINKKGKIQATKIGLFFTKHKIPISKVISSEWCRCKDTASIAFLDDYDVKSFLNSFYSEKFFKNKKKQIKELKEYVNNWNGKKNLIFVTHYVVISEVLDTHTSSGEIVISDKNYNIIESLITKY